MNFRSIILSLLLISNLNVLNAQEFMGDTLNIHAISFNDPSPEGWNAHYESTINFPEFENSWSKIIMVQWLKCDSSTKADKYPCGEWDYIWDTQIKVLKGDTNEIFSIGSFVTPYGKRLKMGGENGWQWIYDVTDYAPILKGKRTIISGNNQELLDLKFLFIKGKPVRNVLSVENIYPYGYYKYSDLADDSVLKVKRINLEPHAKGYRLKARISGHGHEGPRNCCEWDSKTHSYYINEWEHFRWNVWKDCGNNPIYPQGGTWPFDRAGWCPGTKVDEYEFELTPMIKPGDTISFDYSIEHYSNNGEKDGMFRMSHQLFSYGAPNFSNDASLEDIIAPSTKDEYSRINPVCGNPIILIKNTGKHDLKSLVITYGMEGGDKKVFFWQGNLEFLQQEEVVLPVLESLTSISEGVFVAELSLPNKTKDENVLNDSLTSGFDAPITLPGNFTLQINTNNLGRSAENSYTISDDSGKVYFEKSDFADSTQYLIPVVLENGCYQFLFKDNRDDGISIHWWNRHDNPDQIGINGAIIILTTDGKELINFPSDFGEELRFNFIVKN